MLNTRIRAPQQSRSQQTLDRILSSTTLLVAEKSYDDVSIAEIASLAKISVGGFYSRFENKEALFGALLGRLAQETQEGISAALGTDWSTTSLQELLRSMVENNAALYDKYRGVLTAVHIRSRILQPHIDDEHRSYNEKIVAQLETLILKKSNEIVRRQRRVAIRTAIACMTAMLRDAVVFRDDGLYPKPRNMATITRCVADIMHQHLAAKVS